MLFFALAICFLNALSGVRSDSTASQNLFSEWSGWGGNNRNNRWASLNSPISSSNILSIITQCNVSYPIGVSATPVVSGNIVYYPTWNGLFAALDFHACQVLWQVNVTSIISSYAPISTFQKEQTKPVSRTSPQIDGNVVYFGTQTHALIVAVNRLTGQTLGSIQINSHPLAVITMSPTFFDGKLFVGAASVEENVSLLPTYPCCSFVGNMVAVTFDHEKFNVLWNVSMIPAVQATKGWSGVGIWGSQPAIDTNRRQVFIATGNTYSVPDVIIQCQKDTANITAVVQGFVTDSCLPADIWQESVISIDIDLGIVNWVHQLPTLDAFTAACGFPGFSPQNTTLCPEVPGLDTDFGMAPTFVKGSQFTPHGKDTVVVGQKSGNLYAMSAQAGRIFWSIITSPDGLGGGLSWGIAVDDSRVYFTAINSGENAFRLQPSNQLVNRSAYGAASLATGALLWETATPSNGVAYGPPSVVGDIVLVARTGSDVNGTSNYDVTPGGLVALDKTTGKVLMDYTVNSNFHGGVAIQGQYILFGTGYSGFSPPALVPGAINVLRVRN
ncbi:quinon protein alcohol dehydrogenase-like superfamily [Tricladium varicosporioides]|nr:quinon protein alcohol dehydrogenase-like superfamily [Hymenoscyphus varicosporioides]